VRRRPDLGSPPLKRRYSGGEHRFSDSDRISLQLLLLAPTGHAHAHADVSVSATNSIPVIQ